MDLRLNSYRIKSAYSNSRSFFCFSSSIFWFISCCSLALWSSISLAIFSLLFCIFCSRSDSYFCLSESRATDISESLFLNSSTILAASSISSNLFLRKAIDFSISSSSSYFCFASSSSFFFLLAAILSSRDTIYEFFSSSNWSSNSLAAFLNSAISFSYCSSSRSFFYFSASKAASISSFSFLFYSFKRSPNFLRL